MLPDVSVDITGMTWCLDATVTVHEQRNRWLYNPAPCVKCTACSALSSGQPTHEVHDMHDLALLRRDRSLLEQQYASLIERNDLSLREEADVLRLFDQIETLTKLIDETWMYYCTA